MIRLGIGLMRAVAQGVEGEVQDVTCQEQMEVTLMEVVEAAGEMAVEPVRMVE